MVSRALTNTFLDIFFPPHCPFCAEAVAKHTRVLCGKCFEAFKGYLLSGPLCEICGTPFKSPSGENHTCGVCLKKPPAFIRARSLYTFEGEVREAVHALKYRWGTMLGPFLGGVMASEVKRRREHAGLIVPVPLHRKKIAARGFNQSVVLARHMAKALSVELEISNLVRTKPTPSQVGLAGNERRKNVSGAFMVRDARPFKGVDVILVDDVFTTGATVGECAVVLKRAGARVVVCTLARAVH